jgi:hypothetical protein
MQDEAGAHGAAPSIAFTRGRYGKMLEIALVLPGKLKGIVNRAFTTSAACCSWGAVKERVGDRNSPDCPTVLHIFAIENRAAGLDR